MNLTPTGLGLSRGGRWSYRETLRNSHLPISPLNRTIAQESTGLDLSAGVISSWTPLTGRRSYTSSLYRLARWRRMTWMKGMTFYRGSCYGVLLLG
jgi:hypothetical protein